MKDLGSFVKKYSVKWLLSFVYILPILLLLVGIVMIAVSAFKSPPDQRNYYWGIIVVMLMLILILWIARKTSLPKYFIEVHQEGIRMVYSNPTKNPDVIYRYEEIPEIWLFAINNGKRPNYLVLKASDGYKIIPPKFNDSKGLIKQIVDYSNKVMLPKKSLELTEGKRLTFSVLPEDSSLVVNSEKAIIPYLEKSQKEFVSLDRFSLFDGKMTYALADIKQVNTDTTTGNINITTIGNKQLYSKNYLSLCNADLFANLVNEQAENLSQTGNA